MRAGRTVRTMVLALAAVWPACGRAAWAGPGLTVTGVSLAPNADTVRITTPVQAATWAGPILLATSLGNLVTWCIDVYADIYLGAGQNLAYQTGAIAAGVTDGDGGTLSGAQAQQVAALVAYGSALYGANPSDADHLAAIQLAIWSVENAGFTFTGTSQAVVDDTSADLAMAARAAPAAVTGLFSLVGTQNLAMAAIPEPASVLLLGSGVAAAAGMWRLRRRSRRAGRTIRALRLRPDR